LRRLLDLAKQLRRRGLVETHVVVHAQDADRLEQPERAQGIGVGGVFRRLEAHLHVALGREIVDFGGFHLAQQAQQVGRVRHVAIVQEQARSGVVAVAIEIVDALGVEQRRPAFDAVDDVPAAQQEVGEIGAVLPGDAGDECDFF
jgi:hypothetical protein